MICPRCNTNNEEGAITCIGCGFDLRGQTQSKENTSSSTSNIFEQNMGVNLSSPYFENNVNVDVNTSASQLNDLNQNIDSNVDVNINTLQFNGFNQDINSNIDVNTNASQFNNLNQKIDSNNNQISENIDELMEKSDFDISKVINQSKEISSINQSSSVNLMNNMSYENSIQNMEIPKENVIDNKFDQKKNNRKTIIFIIVAIAAVATILTIVLLIINGKKENSSKTTPVNTKTEETTNDVKINYLDVKIIYFNPITGQLCNDHVPENSLNENKVGCMRWYIYAEDTNGNYLALLDHNTHDNIPWNSDINSSEINEPNVALLDLTMNYNWQQKLNPRLIGADEIATITGANIGLNWNSKVATTDNAFIFGLDKYGNELTNTEKQIQQTYHWLYDYTTGCLEYNCLLESANTALGYWTSTPVSNNNELIWIVFANGSLASGSRIEFQNYLGVRPVITISKEVIDLQ